MATDKTNAHLQRLHEAARQAGLECLDSEWRNIKTRYRFRCAQGHEYLCFPDSVLDHGNTCPECRDSRRLAHIHAAAAQFGGQCLETHYLGATTARYRFVCAAGHRWTAARGGLLQRGHWCKRCSAAQRKLRWHKDGLERLQAASRAKGGECLDTTYRGVDVRYS